MSESNERIVVEGYKCPVCKEMLPLRSVNGAVTVECLQCNSKIRVSMRVLEPEELSMAD